MTAPAERYIARALAEALRERVIEANTYLDEWQALEWASVPLEHIRAVLDVEAHASEARRELAAWDGRGAWCCCGTVGVGKTYAAALWVLERHRRGLDSRWVSAAAWALLNMDQQRDLLNSAHRAGGLVVDDVGAGLTEGKGFRSRAHGLLLDRAQRPTLVLANSNLATFEEWLGAPLVDRIRVAGKLLRIEAESLRRPGFAYDPDDKKSPQWHAAADLVRRVGVLELETAEREDVEDRWGGTYERLTGRMVKRVQVGHVLERGTEAARRALVVSLRLTQAEALALRVTPAQVLDAAKVLAAGDETPANEQRLAAAQRMLADRRRAETERDAVAWRKALRAIEERRRGQPDPSTLTLTHPAPKRLLGEAGRAELKRLGYSVRPCKRRAGFEAVRRTSDPKLMVPCMETEATADLAWEGLAALVGHPGPPIPVE